jgi:hypothetical protein
MGRRFARVFGPLAAAAALAVSACAHRAGPAPSSGANSAANPQAAHAYRGCRSRTCVGGDARKRQYFDERRRRYYYFDPEKKRYYWEDGQPRL